MRIKLPENCLRNSYATYAQTFRSLGDVAKAMGDQEATVKRYYIETLEPNVGMKGLKLNYSLAVVSRRSRVSLYSVDDKSSAAAEPD
jgi:hypothetical protein